MGVYVVDLPDGKPRKVYEGPIAPRYEDVISPIWSPVGRDIAIATGTQLLLVSADSGESRLAVDDGALYVAFSPDGSRVAYTAKRGDVTDLFVADLEGGSPIEIASGPMGWGVDWSPDGSRIVFSSRESTKTAPTGSAATAVRRE